MEEQNKSSHMMEPHSSYFPSIPSQHRVNPPPPQPPRPQPYYPNYPSPYPAVNPVTAVSAVNPVSRHPGYQGGYMMGQMNPTMGYNSYYEPVNNSFLGSGYMKE